MPKTDTVEFADGSMWEGLPWGIRFNEECSEFSGGKMCKHCIDKRTRVHKSKDRHRKEVIWTCPRVVVAFNEGGYNSTGVCLDCILEAVNKIKEE